MKSPLVTVLLPVYNSGKFLTESVDSILNQTFKDFELVIIDDGSNDKSLSIIKGYADKDDRISIVEHSQNQGLVSTLNEGLAIAKGEYIARMDADDIALPTRLSKQVAFLKAHPMVDVVATSIDPFDDKTGKSLDLWPEEKQTTTPDDIKQTLPVANCVAHPTIMGRAEVLRKYRYRSAQKNIEDYDLWLRMVSDGKVISKIPEKLLRYRVTSNSITGGDDGQKRLLLAKFRFVMFRLLRLHFSKFDRRVCASLCRGTYRYFRTRVSGRINARIK